MTYPVEPDAHVIAVRVVEQPPAPAPPKVRSVYRVVTLVPGSGETIATSLLLPESNSRLGAYVQALDDDVTISNVESDAKKGAGTIIPANNTAPWPIFDDAAVYVACTPAGASARVSVCAYYRA